uniref:NADH dehydrogenase subunit 2 n=1 Tax=Ferrissia californica TaxID=1776375 RepID=UPI00315D1CEC
MSSSTMMFLMMTLFSPLLSIMMNDWIFCWAMMEISMISLFPLLSSNSSKESMMKYFLIQSLASMLLLIIGLLYFNIFEYEYIYYYFFLMSLSLKIGFFPGHFWVPSMMSSVGIISLLLLLGPMKFAPLAFFNLSFMTIPEMNYIILFLAVVSAILGAILGNNQTNVRSMLGSSSISHSGWMIVAMCYNWLWMYFFSYMIIMVYFCFSMFYQDYFSMMINILSMSGVPPFLMFIMKMKVLLMLSYNFEYLMFLVLIISSVFSLIFYMKYFFVFLMTVKKVQKFNMMMFLIINALGVFVLF